MVNISSLVLTVALFATTAFSIAIPPNAHHHSVTPANSEDQLQTIAARDPNLFSLGRKLAKEGIHVAKSRKGRKVIKGVAKGAFEVAGFL